MGMAWLCLQCDLYKAARNAGIEGDACMAAVTNQQCASPLAGLSFPLYAGPVTVFQRFCFVCGKSAVRGMKARGSERVFGLCRDHGPEWVNRLKEPVAAELPPLMTHQDAWMPATAVPRKVSLIEHMLDFDPQAFDPLPTASTPAEEKKDDQG